MTAIQLLAAIAFGLILAVLCGCSDDFERLQRQADWQAKVARAALPKEGELVTVRQFSDGQYIFRRYHGGLKETNVIAREE